MVGIALMFMMAEQLSAPSEVSYEREEVVATTTLEVVTVDILEERIKEAQEAKRAEIEEAAERAYNALYEEKMTEVADSVKEAYIAEIEATISSESY